ncbi:MAG: virulence RhuM family protein [Elusimicrobia bacterium]|nr:virulence RhuM family protein [Elusimicrobiota bacterium]
MRQISVENKKLISGEIVLYNNKVEVRLEKETVWLRQEQIAALFGTQRPAITKHLNNIFKAKELSERSVCSILAHTAADGKKYKTKHFNLDAVISVGYRINSVKATQFRVWATNVLRAHLVDGYTLNEKRLKEHAAQKYLELRWSVDLLGNLAELESVAGETRGVVQVINENARALDLLDDYDYQRMAVPKGTRREMFAITYDGTLMR